MAIAYNIRENMKHTAMICSAILLAAFSGYAAENLLQNPGFELKDGSLADGWKDGTSVKQKISSDRDSGHPEKKSSLRVDIEKDGGKNLGQIIQEVKAKPDTAYRFKGDLKASAKEIALYQIKLIGPDKKELKRIGTGSNKEALKWESVSTDFTTPGDIVAIQVICRFNMGESSIGKTAWFANPQLEERGELFYEGAEVAPKAVPTFNSIGIYWKPNGGGPKRQCTVKYRKAGENTWREALDLWFDPTSHEGMQEHSLEYRGSIVHLDPNTKYEIELSIEKIGMKKVIETQTWNDNFPIAKKVELPAKQVQPFIISEGGSPEKGYVLYSPPAGAKVTWDGGNEALCNIKVDASWVIIRGLTLTNAKNNGIELGDVNHVVIEDCDISGWGQNDPKDGYGYNLQSAIYSKSKKLSQIVVQRCSLHHPRSDSNSWREKQANGNSHPRGPQGISFLGGQGEYVIRNNRIFSDLDHMFNDAMGEVHNFSYDGFPNRDSDINDNFVSHCWDDGLEIEGANMNVRVWNNYIDYTWDGIGAATTVLGPSYFWRNIYAVSRAGPKTDASGYRGHCFFKLGNEDIKWSMGRMYVFHNTSLQPPPYAGHEAPSGAQAGITFTGDKKQQENIITRNNIFHLRINDEKSVIDYSTPSNDFDYDMHNGRVIAKEGSESHGIKAEPVYERATDGRLWLKPGSTGHDTALRIPNFNDDFAGNGPDMGAVETSSKNPKPSTWPEFPAPSSAITIVKEEVPPPAVKEDKEAPPAPAQEAVEQK
ncbi:MAG TPA: hypothetical protein DCZ94_17345 [Lentisphaeria bacterium]|nr:MAG: hypothetical protein A2X48_20835 [Lentisphaerae bacterium GWF2_49_21]HBC88709.1 hypothetical protein [Lentisphaeria bacterium]